MPSPPAPPAQSVLFDTLMNAVANLIYQGTSLCPANYQTPTGAGPVQLDPTKIVEWYGDDRPTIEGQQIITYGILGWRPKIYSGAGRLASLTDMILDIRVWTRFGVDRTGKGYAWFRAQSRGHWLRVFQVMNAFAEQMLNTAYDAVLNPTGTPLSQHVISDVSEQFAEVFSKDPEWGLSSLKYSVPVVKPILQPPLS